LGVHYFRNSQEAITGGHFIHVDPLGVRVQCERTTHQPPASRARFKSIVQRFQSLIPVIESHQPIQSSFDLSD
jgi:hypothetical protein